jgi:hypothetical protein
MSTYTTATAAAKLGLCPRQVGQLARQHGIGTKKGRDWQFTAAQVARMAKRPTVGRPRKGVK